MVKKQCTLSDLTIENLEKLADKLEQTEHERRDGLLRVCLAYVRILMELVTAEALLRVKVAELGDVARENDGDE